MLYQNVVDNVTSQNTCIIKTALFEGLFYVKLSIILDKLIVNWIAQEKVIDAKRFKLFNLLHQIHNHLNFFSFIAVIIFAFC